MMSGTHEGRHHTVTDLLSTFNEAQRALRRWALGESIATPSPSLIPRPFPLPLFAKGMQKRWGKAWEKE